MKKRQLLILLPLVFAIVALLFSCQAKRQTFISAQPGPAGLFQTNLIEFGTSEVRLKVQLDDKGNCEKLWVDGRDDSCENTNIVKDLEETFFCTSPDEDHPANASITIEGKKGVVYCGNIRTILPDGAEIQYYPALAPHNRKCKKIGGTWYCTP